MADEPKKDKSRFAEFLEKNSRAIISSVAAFVLIVVLLGVERSLRVKRGVPSDSVEAGQSLPPQAKLRNFKTKKDLTFNDFKGKVLLINFWASWCEACIAEMPSIVKLYEKLKPQGFEVLAINVDENPDAVVPKMIEQLGLNFEVYVDMNGVLSQTFDVVAIPFSIVADREQKLVWIESGERDWMDEKVVEKLQDLLK